MAKKTTKKASKKITIHHRLEKPVHNMVGYTVLLLLAVVIFFIVYGMKMSSGAGY